MRLSRFFLLHSFLAAFVFCLSFAAMADAEARKYNDIDLLEMTRFSAHYKSVDLNNIEVFKDYLHLSDCKVYDIIKDDPFKLQEAQQAVIKDLAEKYLGDHSLYLRLPVVFYINGYNFDTQSFPVIESNRFNKVNMLQLVIQTTPICGNYTISNLKTMPTSYVLKLNMPISLYRIPIQKDIAESLSNRLTRDRPDSATRLLYGYILLKAEAIQPELQKENMGPYRLMLHGDVEAIDLYIDQDRKILFKRLDYGEGM